MSLRGGKVWSSCGGADLVKSGEKRPRVTILRKEFAIAIAYINQQSALLVFTQHDNNRKPNRRRISYIPWDVNYHAKQRGTFILSDMASSSRLDWMQHFFSMCHREDDITSSMVDLKPTPPFSRAERGLEAATQSRDIIHPSAASTATLTRMREAGRHQPVLGNLCLTTAMLRCGAGPDYFLHA
ncbi:TPA: hypothetical protein ACH3X2_013084, partial [Trebouxia sp. C0005]